MKVRADPAVPAVVELRNVTKTYGPVRALVGCPCRFEAGHGQRRRRARTARASRRCSAIVGTLTRPTLGRGRPRGARCAARRRPRARSAGWVTSRSAIPDLTGRREHRARGATPRVRRAARRTSGRRRGSSSRRSPSARADVLARPAAAGGARAGARARAAASAARRADDRARHRRCGAAEAVVSRRGARGAVVVVVTHDAGFGAAVGGHVVTLDRGRAVSDESLPR